MNDQTISYLSQFVTYGVCVVLAMVGFEIGVYLVLVEGWYAPYAALPIYPIFALLLTGWFRFTHHYFGAGLDLRGHNALIYIASHLAAFTIANSVYAWSLWFYDTVDFRWLALPCMTLTLLLCVMFNKKWRPHT